MRDVSARFDGAPVYTHPAGEGGPNVQLYRPRVAAVPPPVLLHQVAAGDRLDTLASRYYGDPEQYWRIVDANPCATPEELLELGRTLRIPRGGV